MSTENKRGEHKMNFEEIKVKVIQTIWRMNQQAERGDVNRNHVNYGAVQAYGDILRCMGHETELNNCWENDKGCLVINSAKIDGEALPI